MRIGILSDTHDNLRNVQAAADILRREGIATLLHCGDVCGPAVIEALQGFDLYVALGNVDRMPALGLAVEALHGVGRLARWHSLVLDGSAVALLHGDEEPLLHHLIRSGEFAYVIHGHTHRRDDRRMGTTRVINPGALGGTRHEPRSFCILDLKTGEARFVELQEGGRRG
ncbi:MAG TPA: YfcE family phosphodiesterase [Chloroflexi bacterium]|nr:YfcE family phosphodiesterase [Chloroflexota bacterium]